jgi:hypothetical protein
MIRLNRKTRPRHLARDGRNLMKRVWLGAVAAADHLNKADLAVNIARVEAWIASLRSQ